MGFNAEEQDEKYLEPTPRKKRAPLPEPTNREERVENKYNEFKVNDTTMLEATRKCKELGY